MGAAAAAARGELPSPVPLTEEWHEMGSAQPASESVLEQVSEALTRVELLTAAAERASLRVSRRKRVGETRQYRRRRWYWVHW